MIRWPAITLVAFAWSWATACSTGVEIQRDGDASADAARAMDADVLDGDTSDAVVDGAHDGEVAVDASGIDALGTRFACDGPDAVLPDVAVVAPDFATYLADIANVPSAGGNPPTTFTVDPSDCQPLLWEIYLPLGSAFVHVIPNDDGSCALWLGGEEENPEYNGRPLGYCRLPPSCTPVSFMFDNNGSAGPARLDSPWCTSTGFCTDSSCTE